MTELGEGWERYPTTMKRTYADRNKDNWADPTIRQKMLDGSRKGAKKATEMNQRDRLILEWRRQRTRYGKRFDRAAVKSN